MIVQQQAADAVILAGRGDQMRLLLIKRKFPPFQNSWAFPGGFIEKGEQPLSAARREVLEECHLDLRSVEALPLKVRQKEGRDPRAHVASYPFLFLLDEMQEVRAADDAVEAVWVPLIEVDTLAFDHGAILCEALSYFWQGMPSYHLKDTQLLPIIFSKKSLPVEENIFYGGTFNPWHAGHLECVRQVSQIVGQGIMIIPDSNPLKSLDTHVCYWQRYHSLATRFADSEHAVYPGFLGREIANPTGRWMSRLAKKSSFIMGDDNFFILDRWIEVDSFLQSLTTLYIVPRDFTVDEIKQQVELWKRQYPQLTFVVLAEHCYQHLNSTALRSAKCDL